MLPTSYTSQFEPLALSKNDEYGTSLAQMRQKSQELELKIVHLVLAYVSGVRRHLLAIPLIFSVSGGFSLLHADGGDISLSVRMNRTRGIVSPHEQSIVTGDGRFRHDIFVTISNVSKRPLSIFVGNEGLRGDQLFLNDDGSRKLLRLDMIWFLYRTSRGELVIPAEADLKRVTLRVGEAAEFHIIFLSDTPWEPEQLALRYSITPEFAERFDSWSGTLDAQVVRN